MLEDVSKPLCAFDIKRRFRLDLICYQHLAMTISTPLQLTAYIVDD